MASTQFKNRAEKLFFYLLLLPFFWMLFIHIYRSADFGLSLWAARDFDRALNLLSEFQVSGSEMGAGFGMRLPGGAMYYLWFVPLFLTRSPVVLNICLVALHFCGIVLLFSFLRRLIGNLGAVVGCNIYLASFAVSRVSFQLWNPAVMPVFVAGALYCLGRVLEGKYQYLKWFFLAVALGMQMHFSVAFLVLPAVVATAFCAAGDEDIETDGALARIFSVFGQTFFPCLFFVVLAFLPYIVHEFRNDFTNSRLVFFQELVQDAHRPFLFRAKQTCAAVIEILSGLSACRQDGNSGWILSGGPLWRIFIVIADRGFLALAVAGCVFSFFQRRTKRSVFLIGLFFLFLAVGAVSFYVFFCWKLMVHIRYLYILAPAFSFFAALGAVRVYEWLCARHFLFCSVWAVFIVLVCSFQVFANPNMRINPYSGHYSRIGACLEKIRATTGWTLEETAGRTVFLVTNDDGLTWERDYDYFNLTDLGMSITGKSFPGSGPLPGAVVLWDGARFRDEPETVKNFAQKYLRRDFRDVSVGELVSTDCELIIFYNREQGLAFTGMSNRYILLDEEKTTLEYIDKLSPGTALKLDSERFVADLDGIIYLLLKFECTKDEVTVKIFSNQLRGTVSNYGFYMDGAVLRPALVWKNIVTGEELETVIYEDRVGFDGVFTPLEKRVKVSEGTYDIRFCAEVFGLEMDIYNRPRGGDNEKRSRVDMALGRFEVK